MLLAGGNFALAQPTAPESASLALPAFLPSYYAPALTIEGEKLEFVAYLTKDGTDQYLYGSLKSKVGLVISNAACSSSACETVFNNSLQVANQLATKKAGRFTEITATEFGTAWPGDGGLIIAYAFRLPNTIAFWEFTVPNEGLLTANYIQTLHQLANRQRYEQASALGDVELGRWDVSLRQLAEELQNDGKSADAATVLKAIVATSPTDYTAQVKFAELTTDSAASHESAKVAFENAESGELVSKSAAILKVTDPTKQQLPAVAKGEKGLQVVLIALDNCDVHVLTDAAKVYAGITKIPTKVVRFAEPLQFGDPDRIANQRVIQQFIAQHSGGSVDFKGWTLVRYISELIASAVKSDAVTQFNVKSLLSNLNNETGQYSAETYLDRLSMALVGYRSGDPHTIYVGVTNRNISLGEANYVFGAGDKSPRGYTALVSYHMMEAKYSGAPYEAHKRLVERLAKQLVPATLGALEIPRPADPNDPASYADGIERMDQKSLTLSSATQAAIDRLR